MCYTVWRKPRENSFEINTAKSDFWLQLSKSGSPVCRHNIKGLRGFMELNVPITVEPGPLYPEERACRAPTTDRLLEILGNLSKHTLLLDDVVTQTFPPNLSDMQRDILSLLGVPLSAYASMS